MRSYNPLVISPYDGKHQYGIIEKLKGIKRCVETMDLKKKSRISSWSISHLRMNLAVLLQAKFKVKRRQSIVY